MQRVTKEEFSPAPDYPELMVRTNEKKYSFEEGSYSFQNDTIYGTGKCLLLKNDYLPFEGRISINDVKKIETDRMNNTSDTSNLRVKTEDKEFIFKSEERSYSVKNDTIYGKGKYRFRNVDDQFEGAVNINDAEEIQMDKFNLNTTILLAAAAVLTAWAIIDLSTSYHSWWNSNN